MLKDKVRTQCLNNPDLLAAIAKATGKTPATTIQMLRRNQSKELASVYVLNAISGITGLAHEQILKKAKTKLAA